MNVPMNIAVVEDNDDLRDSLVDMLSMHGYEVCGFSCAEDIMESGVMAFDLMVLDLGLPGEDGLSLAKRLRRVQPRLKVLIMSTRISVEDRVMGYDVGADLYLPKPVAAQELLAAVRALGRQIQLTSRGPEGHGDGRVVLDVHALELVGPLGSVALNPAELALVGGLARAPGQRLEHWQLLELLGQGLDTGGRGNLPVRMARLRSKFEQAGCPRGAIRSLRASGYQLCIALEISAR